MEKIIKLMIWGRDFALPIEYDCYEGESITEKQIEAVEALIMHPEWIEKSKNAVEAYCKDEVLRDNKSDIFSYVDPRYLFVKRNDQDPSVALMLNYRYDPEHGLAVVFKLDGEVAVGSQDIIL